MGLLDKILPRRKQHISRQQTLSSQPMQNPSVRSETRGKSLVLRVPLKQPKTTRLSRALMTLPSQRRVVLDSIGAGIWQWCDQKNTVADIVELTRRRYKFSHKEALISVTTFLKQLGGKGLILFVVPKENKDANPRQ